MKDTVYLSSVNTRMWGSKCPRCGRSAEGGTRMNPEGEKPRDPKPGDFAVCAYCGALCVYTETLRLRRIERTERRKMERDPRLKRLLELMTQAVRPETSQWN